MAELGPSLKTGKYSDFCIVCGGYTFKVHKVVIVEISEFFKKLVDSPMKEGIENTLHLPEDDPCLVARLLCYAYTGNYEFGLGGQLAKVPDKYSNTRLDWDLGIDLIIDMFALSDKYMVRRLQLLIEKALIRYLKNLSLYVPMVGDHNISPDVIAKAAGKIYNSTSAGDWRLREPILQAILEETQSGKSKRSTAIWTSGHKIIRNTLALAADLATSALSAPMECGDCNRKTWQRTWMCKCDQMEYYSDDDCDFERQQRRFCKHCYKFGSMSSCSDSESE